MDFVSVLDDDGKSFVLKRQLDKRMVKTSKKQKVLNDDLSADFDENTEIIPDKFNLPDTKSKAKLQ